MKNQKKIDGKVDISMNTKKCVMLGSAVILTKGLFDTDDAKTAHGLIRGTERFQITGVIDHINVGRDAGEVLDGVHRDIPVYSNMAAYLAAKGTKPHYAIIGVAVPGGQLDEQWKTFLLEIINQGISLVNGMHMLLGDNPIFREAAKVNNVSIIDVRRHKPSHELHFWSGQIFGMKIPRIAVLGTDCAQGKRTTSRMLVELCRESGLHAEMIYTGQTGWLQGSPYGFVLDATTNDFVSGELEAAIVQCEEEACPDLIVVEGQSGMRNPLGPCGTEIIVSGNIKGVILQHTPFREFYDSTEKMGCQLPSIESEIQLIEMYGTKVIAVTLNGKGSTKEDLVSYSINLEQKTGIPVFCPFLAPMGKILPVIQQFIREHGSSSNTATNLRS